MSARFLEKIIFAVLDVIFAVLVVSLRSIHDVLNLKFFNINICGFSNIRMIYGLKLS